MAKSRQQIQADYRKKNREKIEQARQKFKEENPEIVKEWHAKYRAQNQSKINEKNRQRRASDPDKDREYMREYRKEYFKNSENRKRHYETNRDWIKRNPDKEKEYSSRYHARRRGADVGIFNNMDWILIQIEQNGFCYYCEERKILTKDHKTPVSRGGLHDRDNIVGACISCNASKGAKTVEEYKQWLKNR